MQKQQEKPVLHLFGLPTDIIFKIFSHLNKKEFTTLKRSSPSRQFSDLFEKYSSSLYYLRIEIKEFIEELGFLIAPEKIFLSIETFEQHQILIKFLHFFLQNKTTIVNQVPSYPTPPQEIINLIQVIPHNPIATFLMFLTPRYSLKRAMAKLKENDGQPNSGMSFIQAFNTMVRSDPASPNSTLSYSHEHTEKSLSIIVEIIEQVDKKIYKTGNIAANFVLIHLVLDNFAVITKKNKIITVSIDCTYLKKLPLIGDYLQKEANSIPLYSLFRLMLAGLGLFLSDRNKITNFNNPRIAIFLACLNWIDIFYLQPKKAIELLKYILSCLEIEKKDLAIDSSFFNYIYWSSLNSEFQNLRDEIGLDAAYVLMREYISHCKNDCNNNPRLIREILQENKSVGIWLRKDTLNIIKNNKDICWPIEDVHSFIHNLTSGRLALNREENLNLLLNVTGILKYWPKNELDHLYESSHRLLLSNLLRICSHREIIFKRIRKYKDLIDLYNTFIDFSDKKNNILTLLCSHFSKSISEWILINNKTVEEIQKYILVNKEYLILIHQFINVETFLKLTGNAFHPRNISKINWVELNTKLQFFLNLVQEEGLTTEDAILVTFKILPHDIEKMVRVLKNSFTRMYIHQYFLSNDFISKHFSLMEILLTTLNQENIDVVMHLKPDYLLILEQENLLKNLLHEKDFLLLDWLLYDSKTIQTRPIEQVREFIHKGLLEHKKFFIEFKYDKKAKRWFQESWLVNFINSINAELLLTLLTKKLNTSETFLAQIGKQGETFYEMTAINKKTDPSELIMFLKERYEKPWLNFISESDPTHEIFNDLELYEIEKIASDEELFQFLLKNIKLHIKLYSLPSMNFNAYCKLLNIFKELGSGKEDQIVTLIRQYTFIECICFFEKEKKHFIELLSLPKWEFFYLITNHKITDLSEVMKTSKRKAEEMKNERTSISKQQKLNMDEETDRDYEQKCNNAFNNK